MEKTIDDPVEFFRKYGGMHDAKIFNFGFDTTTRILKLSIDDLNASFRGMPEYDGKLAVSMEFAEASNLHLDCGAKQDDVQRVHDLEVNRNAALARYELVLTISPSGIGNRFLSGVVSFGLSDRHYPLRVQQHGAGHGQPAISNPKGSGVAATASRLTELCAVLAQCSACACAARCAHAPLLWQAGA